MRTYPELECRKVKHNGFCRPLHPLQLLTYGLATLQVMISAGVMLTTLQGDYQVSSTQILFGCISLTFQFLVCLFGFYVTISDPTDPIVYQYRKEIATT